MFSEMGTKRSTSGVEEEAELAACTPFAKHRLFTATPELVWLLGFHARSPCRGWSGRTGRSGSGYRYAGIVLVGGIGVLDGAALEGPLTETCGRVPDTGDVGGFDGRNLLPGNGFEIGVAQIRGGEVDSVEFCADEIASDQVRVRHVGVGEDCVFEVAASEICGVEVGVGEVGEAEFAAAEIGGTEIGAQKICMLEAYALKKCGRGVDAHERDFVGVQFLQCLDAAAAAAFALGGVDDLPGLVVALLDAIAGFAEVEDDADQHREAAEDARGLRESSSGLGHRLSIQTSIQGAAREQPAMPRIHPR